ncbi:dCMP deaminase family protein [bacterium]|nr:dCMP deaminase family protein [bacterium]
MPRIPVEIIYMQIAYQTAKLSYAHRRRVGCIIVKDEQIVSFGYNGTPHGFDNQCEETLVETQNYENPDHALHLVEEHGYTCDNGCCTKETQTTKREVLHAESNAITKLAKSTMTSIDADLYTTTAPCFDCAKLIIQAGIKKVYYSEDYRDMSGVELLEKAGITTKQVICWNDL